VKALLVKLQAQPAADGAPGRALTMDEAHSAIRRCLAVCAWDIDMSHLNDYMIQQCERTFRVWLHHVDEHIIRSSSRNASLKLRSRHWKARGATRSNRGSSTSRPAWTTRRYAAYLTGKHSHQLWCGIGGLPLVLPADTLLDSAPFSDLSVKDDIDDQRAPDAGHSGPGFR
jgi:hypothetical protein